MTKTFTETYNTYGTLEHETFGKFILLKALPNTHSVPLPLRDAGYLEWFVLDEKTGEGRNILLNGSCMIVPFYEPVEMEVKLVVEDGEEDD